MRLGGRSGNAATGREGKGNAGKFRSRGGEKADVAGEGENGEGRGDGRSKPVENLIEENRGSRESESWGCTGAENAESRERKQDRGEGIQLEKNWDGRHGGRSREVGSSGR